MNPVAPSSAPIPLVDLAWQHRAVADELVPQLLDALGRGDYVLGDAVGGFERAFAAFSGTDHCAGVANGTDALELGLRAAGVGRGHEVIVPANSFFATAEAVVLAGARPVLVDADPHYHLIDIDQALAARTARTAAVIPVHLYGQQAFVEQLTAELPDTVTVLEDAAQAQGARRHGHGIGHVGHLAATSFYPGKNLGAAGDAGAVLTDDAALDDAVRRLRNHGSGEKYRHERIGRNSRLDTLQAVVLQAKLARLSAWNELRRDAAARYDALLADDERIVPPSTAAGNEHVFHLYVVQLDDRDEVLAALHRAGVGAGVHYPVPLHRQPAMAGFVDAGRRFPRSEALAARALSLPLYPGISQSQQERVAETLRKALDGRAA
ncbi:MAG: DegT/DnrJ/EryC1/StrS family aminotransferase [Acidimicrobiales bacterium]|nr:DegT/DnrJ/EryC1/StrS family aminotransferase [Acidimicrobiales bacterium]